jgi:type IV pilus assembly protein PilM
VVLDVGDSLVRQVELPTNKPAEMRRMIRYNPRNFFQEDLSNYVFDCCASPPPTTPKSSETTQFSKKFKVMVGAARNTLIQDIQAAAGEAGLEVRQISLSQICPANAFLASSNANPDDVVAVVDVGFKNSTINVLVNGEIMLSRVVNVGADKFTSGLAEALGITYPVAEGIKLVMPDKVQSKLQTLIAPLSRDLRASIDFFEDVQNKTVNRVYVSGGSARSAFIVQTLQNELEVPCVTWSPFDEVDMELPPARRSDVGKDAPQLTVCVGAAQAWMGHPLARLNLLAEQQEAAELRRKDPVKRGVVAAVLLILLASTCGVLLYERARSSDREFSAYQAELKGMEEAASAVSQDILRAAETQRTLGALERLARDRFLWATALNALQFTIVDDIQVANLRMEKSVVNTPGTRAVTNSNGAVSPARPATSTETITLRIVARDYADPPAIEKFIRAISTNPYFKEHLRPENAVLLKERGQTQVDPGDLSRTFVHFTIECAFPPRVIRDD